MFCEGNKTHNTTMLVFMDTLLTSWSCDKGRRSTTWWPT